jgi:hypothetical protein
MSEPELLVTKVNYRGVYTREIEDKIDEGFTFELSDWYYYYLSKCK